MLSVVPKETARSERENLLEEEEWEEMSEKEKDFLAKHHLSVYANDIRIKSCQQLFPRGFLSLAKLLHQFEFRPKDIVILSYPRTGTTWLSEMLWAMTSIDELQKSEIEANMDRIHFLHNDLVRRVREDDDTDVAMKFRSVFPGEDCRGAWLSFARLAPDRRVIRSHFLPQLLHPNLMKTAKVVCLLRNPKDTIASYCLFRKTAKNPSPYCKLSGFCEVLNENLIRFGSYWNYVRQVWALRDCPTIHYIFYEDLQRNLMEELQKLNEFYEFHLSKEQLKRVAEHGHIDNMKQRAAKIQLVGNDGFFGKATVGNWATLATPDLDAQMNQWIREEIGGIDINFKYQ